MMTGVATGEVQGLLKLSDKAVYETTWQENTIRQTVDKLDIALDKHSVDIVESPDNQIHITYSKRLTGKTDFSTQVKDGTLTITDQSEKKERNLGRGLDFLLELSGGITARFRGIQIALPKNKTFKDIRIKNSEYSEHVHIARVQTDKGNIKAGDVFYIADSQLTDTQIDAVGKATLDTVSIHGRVTVENN